MVEHTVDIDSKAVVQLSKRAAKLARRLEALPDGKAYNMTLLKCGQVWLLAVFDDMGRKVERIEA